MRPRRTPEDLERTARLDDKDKKFIEAFHASRSLNPELMEARIRSSGMDPAVAERAAAYIRGLARKHDRPGDDGPGNLSDDRSR